LQLLSTVAGFSKKILTNGITNGFHNHDKNYIQNSTNGFNTSNSTNHRINDLLIAANMVDSEKIFEENHSNKTFLDFVNAFIKAAEVVDSNISSSSSSSDDPSYPDDIKDSINGSRKSTSGAPLRRSRRIIVNPIAKSGVYDTNTGNRRKKSLK